MGNCMAGSKKSNDHSNSKEDKSKKSNEKNEKNETNGKKQPTYTFDKYGRKVPVLSDPKDSGLMIRRVNSKEQLQEI